MREKLANILWDWLESDPSITNDVIADQILSLLKEEIEKVENTYRHNPEWENLDYYSREWVIFEESRLAILKLLRPNTET